MYAPAFGGEVSSRIFLCQRCHALETPKVGARCQFRHAGDDVAVLRRATPVSALAGDRCYKEGRSRFLKHRPLVNGRKRRRPGYAGRAEPQHGCAACIGGQGTEP